MALSVPGRTGRLLTEARRQLAVIAARASAPWVEEVRVGVQVATVLDEVGTEGQGASGGEPGAAEHGVLGDGAGDQPGRRVNAQRLADHLPDHVQPVQVLVGRSCSGHDAVDLAVDRRLDVGVGCQQGQRPGQGRGGCLGAGGEEGQDLVG